MNEFNNEFNLKRVVKLEREREVCFCMIILLYKIFFFLKMCFKCNYILY